MLESFQTMAVRRKINGCLAKGGRQRVSICSERCGGKPYPPAAPDQGLLAQRVGAHAGSRCEFAFGMGNRKAIAARLALRAACTRTRLRSLSAVVAGRGGPRPAQRDA